MVSHYRPAETQALGKGKAQQLPKNASGMPRRPAKTGYRFKGLLDNGKRFAVDDFPATLGIRLMLFYISLFLFCIALSSIVLWIYRSVYETGMTAYRAIFPSNKKQYKTDQQVDMHTSINTTLTPWGWSGDRGPRRAIAAAPAVSNQAAPAPWGWKGNRNNAESASHSLKGDIGEAAASLRKMVGGNAGNENADVGWPYRDEKFEFADRQYKVTRKRTVKKTNMSEVSKPWGW